MAYTPTRQQQRQKENAARVAANHCVEANAKTKVKIKVNPKQPVNTTPKPLHDGRADQRPLSYAYYLRTQHWSIVRTKMVKRANHRCMNCHCTGKLNVHHKNYAHLWYEYAADLQVLCEACHEIGHGLFVWEG